MVLRIIKVEVFGMKGIEKPIVFQFLNDTIDFVKVQEESSLKAIYGLNGSGKSSFITAIDIYKKICSQGSYLVQESTIKTLDKLINKKTKRFGIKIYFLETVDRLVYCHELIVNNETSKPFIEREKISRIMGKTITSKVVDIIELENGRLTVFTKEDTLSEVDKFLYESMNRLNGYTSVVSLFYDVNFVNSLSPVLGSNFTVTDVFRHPIFLAILFIWTSTISLFVFKGRDDLHEEMDSVTYEIFARHFQGKMSENPIVCGDRIIPKNLIEAYERQVLKMTRFIRLFKPELQRIEVERKEDVNYFRCHLTLIYDGYSVDYDYESTGLKNMMSIFSCLDAAASGSIAFIDEMDANMNEVYLSKLCEFFTNHSKGQLCFTTHNTGPMEILKKKKHGIDFINNNQENVPWIRNGNYSPSKMYKEGFVPGIPFNVEDFDFADVFSDEEV